MTEANSRCLQGHIITRDTWVLNRKPRIPQRCGRTRVVTRLPQAANGKLRLAVAGKDPTSPQLPTTSEAARPCYPSSPSAGWAGTGAFSASHRLPTPALPSPRPGSPGYRWNHGRAQARCGDFRESSSPPVGSLLLSTAQAAAWHPPPSSVNPTFLSPRHPVSRHLTCTAAAPLPVCSCPCSAAGTLLSWDTRRLSPVRRWLEPPHAQAVSCLSAPSTWVASCLSSGLEARAL